MDRPIAKAFVFQTKATDKYEGLGLRLVANPWCKGPIVQGLVCDRFLVCGLGIQLGHSQVETLGGVRSCRVMLLPT